MLRAQYRKGIHVGIEREREKKQNSAAACPILVYKCVCVCVYEAHARTNKLWDVLPTFMCSPLFSLKKKGLLFSLGLFF